MGLFKRHKFKISPLSLAVPLDGTETVTGLRELQVQQDGHNLARALHIDQSLQGEVNPFSRTCKRSCSYRAQCRVYIATSSTLQSA